MPKSETFICINTVAEIADVSTKTIRRMVKDGRCPPPFKFGGGFKWRKSVITEWMFRMAIINEIDPEDIFGGTIVDNRGQSGTNDIPTENPASNPKKPR